jgi:3-oxoacyl-[acyl-carrier protein] reductase
MTRTDVAAGASPLAGVRALVTAGGQGIGAAIVRRLADQGAAVAIHCHRSLDAARALADGIVGRGGLAVVVAGDLRRRGQAEALVEQAERALGGLSLLVNNAGSLVRRSSLRDLDEELWREVQEVNLDSMVWVTRAALPCLAAARPAAVVNLASLAGRKGGHAGSLAYATAKGAVLTFTRALAAEVGADGIRVNAIAPGLILGTSFHATHTSVESAVDTVRAIPVGRAGGPDDVARAVAFLAAERDGFIHGATIDINGGAYCC